MTPRKFHGLALRLGVALAEETTRIRGALADLEKHRQRVEQQLAEAREETLERLDDEDDDAVELADAVEEIFPPTTDDLRGVIEAFADDWQRSMDRFAKAIDVIEGL